MMRRARTVWGVIMKDGRGRGQGLVSDSVYCSSKVGLNANPQHARQKARCGYAPGTPAP